MMAKPQIFLETIHAVKGGEADNVLLLTDMSRRTYQNLQYEPDDENRVLYVGCTRAKKNLFILTPRTLQRYRI